MSPGDLLWPSWTIRRGEGAADSATADGGRGGLRPEAPRVHAAGTLAWFLAAALTAVASPTLHPHTHAGRQFAVLVVVLVLVGVGLRTAAWLPAFRPARSSARSRSGSRSGSGADGRSADTDRSAGRPTTRVADRTLTEVNDGDT